jgi:hypothetical protein
MVKLIDTGVIDTTLSFLVQFKVLASYLSNILFDMPFH